MSKHSFRVRAAYRHSFHQPMSTINVTPFVDVMLVLLIVFMVTAPLLTVGVKVNLPQTQAAGLNESTEPIVVSLDGEGKVYIQNTEVGGEALIPKLQAITKNNPKAQLFVRGDQDLAYGRIMETMGQISSAGFEKVALLAETPQKS